MMEAGTMPVSSGLLKTAGTATVILTHLTKVAPNLSDR